LEPFREDDERQWWVIASLDHPTTVVPFIAKDQQAAPNRDSNNIGGSFVVAETSVKPQLWLFKAGTNPEGLIIDEVGKTGVAERSDPIWSDKQGLPGDDIPLEHDHGSFAQRWVLQPAPINK